MSKPYFSLYGKTRSKTKSINKISKKRGGDDEEEELKTPQPISPSAPSPVSSAPPGTPNLPHPPNGTPLPSPEVSPGMPPIKRRLTINTKSVLQANLPKEEEEDDTNLPPEIQDFNYNLPLGCSEYPEQKGYVYQASARAQEIKNPKTGEYKYSFVPICQRVEKKTQETEWKQATMEYAREAAKILSEASSALKNLSELLGKNKKEISMYLESTLHSFTSGKENKEFQDFVHNIEELKLVEEMLDRDLKYCTISKQMTQGRNFSQNIQDQMWKGCSNLPLLIEHATTELYPRIAAIETKIQLAVNGFERSKRISSQSAISATTTYAYEQLKYTLRNIYDLLSKNWLQITEFLAFFYIPIFGIGGPTLQNAILQFFQDDDLTSSLKGIGILASGFCEFLGSRFVGYLIYYKLKTVIQENIMKEDVLKQMIPPLVLRLSKLLVTNKSGSVSQLKKAQTTRNLKSKEAKEQEQETNNSTTEFFKTVDLFTKFQQGLINSLSIDKRATIDNNIHTSLGQKVAQNTLTFFVDLLLASILHLILLTVSKFCKIGVRTAKIGLNAAEVAVNLAEKTGEATADNLEWGLSFFKSTDIKEQMKEAGLHLPRDLKTNPMALKENLNEFLGILSSTILKIVNITNFEISESVNEQLRSLNRWLDDSKNRPYLAYLSYSLLTMGGLLFSWFMSPASTKLINYFPNLSESELAHPSDFWNRYKTIIPEVEDRIRQRRCNVIRSTPLDQRFQFSDPFAGECIIEQEEEEEERLAEENARQLRELRKRR